MKHQIGIVVALIVEGFDVELIMELHSKFLATICFHFESFNGFCKEIK